VVQLDVIRELDQLPAQHQLYSAVEEAVLDTDVTLIKLWAHADQHAFAAVLQLVADIVLYIDATALQ
jgi:hypothetical protein